MASVPMMISGVLWDKATKSGRPVALYGEAYIVGLEVGGGPIIPGGEPPLGIWGPPDMPPGFWGGGMGPGVKPQPKPEHPIVLPDPPTEPPPTPGEPKPPPPGGGWGWHPEYGWGYFPMVGGKPQPPGGAAARDKK